MSTTLNLATFLTPEHLAVLIHGMRLTGLLAVSSWLLAATVGLVLAVARESGGRAIGLAVALFVAYQRNIPALAHLLLWYFGVPALLPESVQSWVNANNGELIFATVALGLCLGAYFCEDIRSGFRSIQSGQHEAAVALGLNLVTRMRYVIMPQALRIALPPLVNHTVLLFKTTSLAMAIGLAELTYVVRELENQTFRTFDAYLLATIVYLVISLAIMGVGSAIEQRYRIPAR